MFVTPAHAKINLALEVVGRRGDGWHEIDTIILPIDWHDLVGMRESDGGVRLWLTGPQSPGLPGADGAAPAEENLAFRAANGLLQEVGVSASHGVDIWIDKRLPAGAGLGGVSADAAATLRAAQRLLRAHGVRVDDAALDAAALQIGSDVPAMLRAAPVRATGRGGEVTPLEAPLLQLVVVWLAPMQTGDVYARLLPDECSASGRIDGVARALHAAERVDDDLLGSALEPAALRVSDTLAAAAVRLRAFDSGVRWHMTGSGGAYFTVSSDAGEAKALAQRLRDDGFTARACRTHAS
ncbi:MAG: 4-(cytidine 5'-diphospho)-2-C-methyl-D-erythritol kinase [Candidatus Dormibacteria bacterium]